MVLKINTNILNCALKFNYLFWYLKRVWIKKMWVFNYKLKREEKNCKLGSSPKNTHIVSKYSETRHAKQTNVFLYKKYNTANKTHCRATSTRGRSVGGFEACLGRCPVPLQSWIPQQDVGKASSKETRRGIAISFSPPPLHLLGSLPGAVRRSLASLYHSR